MKKKRIIPPDVGLQPYERYEDESQIGFTTPIHDVLEHLQSIADSMDAICNDEADNLSSGRPFDALRWLEAFESCVLIDRIKNTKIELSNLNEVLYLCVRVGTLSTQANVRPAERAFSIGARAPEIAAVARSKRPPKFVMERSELVSELKKLRKRYPNATTKAMQGKLAAAKRCSQSTIANLCTRHNVKAKDYSV